MTVCVYAIVGPRPGRIGVAGIGGERLRLVTVGSIAAVVGDRRTAPRPSEPALRAYDRAIGALARRVPALLPARFGTCARGDDDVRRLLDDRAPALRRALARVRGRAQMTVRIVEEGGSVARPSRSSRAPRLDPGASGAAYLRARAEALGREETVLAFEPLRPAVARWVRAERVERHGKVATIYHLIPRGAAHPYRRALARAAHDAGVRLVVSGPWPAYAFADRW